MERELGKLKGVLMGIMIFLMAAAAWMFASVPCRIIDGVGYCSFHEVAEEPDEAWKGLVKGW